MNDARFPHPDLRHRTLPEVSLVLAGLAAVGPFFELRDAVAERAEGRTLRTFAVALGELEARVERTRVALGAARPLGTRIAASITLQGLAAKLVSGPVAALALHDVVVDVSPDTLWWSATPAGDAVALDPVRIAPPPPGRPLDRLVDDVVTPMLDAVAHRFRVSTTVLWGNVASSVAGAKRVLDIQRPDAAGAVAAVAARMLEHPSLAGAGELRAAVPPDQVWTYRRRSCCLYYRLPGGSVCADCVLQNRWRG